MQASTINMAQALLDRGRGLWEQDRYTDASRVLSRLLSLRVIAPEIAERAQFYLGDIQLAEGQYAKARRHLAAAIGSGSASGETHFLMACALEWDEDTDVERAYRHYRQAVQMEPGQPLYSSAYALMRIRRKPEGRRYDREAHRRLRAAFAAAPDDPDVVYNYVFGLIEMGNESEAEIALRRARKQWPDHPAFAGLWSDFQSRRAGLAPVRPVRAGTVPLRVFDEDRPRILPFGRDQAAAPARAGTPRRMTLRAALDRLTPSELGPIRQNLQLPGAVAARESRREIRSVLLDPQRLRVIVQSLSIAGRHLIQVMDRAGGSSDARRLKLRVDPPSTHQPHFRRPVARPLDELRRHGLIFSPARSDDAAGDQLVIPHDLCKLLRQVMRSG